MWLQFGYVTCIYICVCVCVRALLILHDPRAMRLQAGRQAHKVRVINSYCKRFYSSPLAAFEFMSSCQTDLIERREHPARNPIPVSLAERESPIIVAVPSLSRNDAVCGGK